MKSILICCTALLSVMLLSFQQQKQITRLKSGNYFAKKPVVINETDAKTLLDMTKASASETTVVHQTIWKHKDAATLKVKGRIVTAQRAAAGETTVVHQTIWKHKDASKLNLSRDELATVNTIMAKYSK